MVPEPVASSDGTEKVQQTMELGSFAPHQLEGEGKGEGEERYLQVHAPEAMLSTIDQRICSTIGRLLTVRASTFEKPISIARQERWVEEKAQ